MFTNNFFIFLRSVHCSGRFQNQKDIGAELKLFADMQDYVNQKIQNGQILTMQVMSSNVDPIGRAYIKFIQLLSNYKTAHCNYHEQTLTVSFGEVEIQIQAKSYLISCPNVSYFPTCLKVYLSEEFFVDMLLHGVQDRP